MCSKLFLLSCMIVLSIVVHSQKTNTDPNLSYINVNVPRTPESAAFEKYGDVSVNEFTGTPNISVPIYNLKSKFLEVPIALTYHPDGIKVSQEASWVGLGFDLIAGGRITVETRGSVDFCGSTNGLFSATNLSYGMQKIFKRLSNSREVGVLTYATTADSLIAADSVLDNLQTVQSLTQFGAGEPDIFRANFMGHSLKFYFDKVTGNLNWLGEQSLFRVNYTKDNFNNVTDWTIVDNSGITYYFNQTEVTSQTLPSGVVPPSSTSAWLLTKLVHPAGDSILFTYNNYGNSCPAFNISSSIDYYVPDGTATISSDQFQNVSVLSPYYLTRIETGTTAVDFFLDIRNDIAGAGSKKLVKIVVTDKITGKTIKNASFNYSYFASTYHPCSSYLSTLSYYLPSGVTTSAYLNCSSLRLRLDSVFVNDPSFQTPYKFYYNSSIGVPDKYSFSQDHWGYYNAINNSGNGCSLVHMIPNSGLGTTATVIPTLNVYALSRDCDPTAMLTMMLDSVIYPTGGSSKFIFEPHQSTMMPTIPVTGGGLRIKTIKNYSLGALVGLTEYTYVTGKYMGNIMYHTRTATLKSCSGQGWTTQEKQSSNGVVNDNEILIGYPQITVTQKDANGHTNGYLVKSFNIVTPQSSYANGGIGFDVLPAHRTVAADQAGCILGDPGSNPAVDFLYPSMCGFASTPASNLEGKLSQEKYYDSLNVLLKSVDYYYRLANYTNNFFSIRAIQNRNGGFNTSCGTGSPNWYCCYIRPVVIFVSPAKSFYTLTDSIVEKEYQGAKTFIQKKAFRYDNYYQPEFVTSYNSDGSQTINYTKTNLSYIDQAVQVGGYQFVSLIQGAHIFDVPIEQVTIRRTTTGDSLVTKGIFNVYNGSLLKKVFLLETNSPLTFRSQFAPSSYSSLASAITFDSKYHLRDSAEYYTTNLVRDLSSVGGRKAFVWDDTYNTLLAQCIDATSNNIAFSSFETSTKGGWTYPGAPIWDPSAPTGKKAYDLSTGSINKSALDASKTYIISYWYKTGAMVTISGGTQIGNTTGRSFGSWTYKEYKISSPTTITISGTGTIDELRLFPDKTMMNTYSYYQLVGLQSQADPNNIISYYEYDQIGRLQLIKDMDNNILKKIDYKYQTCLSPFTNTTQSKVFLKSTCATGYVSSPVTYIISAGKYSSCTNQAEVDQAVQNDFNLNGQIFADDPANAATCTACSAGGFTPATNWSNYYNNIYPTSNRISFTVVMVATSSGAFTNISTTGVVIGTINNACCRPYSQSSFSCNETSRVWSITVSPNGQVLLVYTGGSGLPALNSSFTLTGTFNL